jgi:hypothetical protein
VTRYRSGVDDESMALVATFAFPDKAYLTQGLLEAAGIPAYLRHENVMRLMDSQVSPNELEAQAEAAGPREDFETS